MDITNGTNRRNSANYYDLDALKFSITFASRKSVIFTNPQVISPQNGLKIKRFFKQVNLSPYLFLDPVRII